MTAIGRHFRLFRTSPTVFSKWRCAKSSQKSPFSLSSVFDRRLFPLPFSFSIPASDLLLPSLYMREGEYSFQRVAKFFALAYNAEYKDVMLCLIDPVSMAWTILLLRNSPRWTADLRLFCAKTALAGRQSALKPSGMPTFSVRILFAQNQVLRSIHTALHRNKSNSFSRSSEVGQTSTHSAITAAHPENAATIPSA